MLLTLAHGLICNMEGDWEYSTDQEFCQRGDVSSLELCLEEEVTVEEFYRLQEQGKIQDVSPCNQEWHQQEAGVRAQWGDGTEQELGMDQWEKK